MRLKILIILLFISIGSIAQKKENIGKGINSAYREINPIVSPDGKKLYFTRVNHPENNYGINESEDCWVSDYNEVSGKWDKAVRMPLQFNSTQINSILSVTPDGNVFLIRGAFENGIRTGKGLSLIYREKNGYSKPEKLDIKYYEKLDKGIYSGGFLANDGKTLLLYFSTSFNSEICDIYVSTLKTNGTWSKIFSLGNTINTREYDEISPFLASDGKTLYFSSNRPGGYGSYDIYMSRRLDKSWKNWSKPVNLGPIVNSENWEAYYSISGSGDIAYMTSTENSEGLEDIITIKLSEDIAPAPVVIISGKVRDGKTGEYINAYIQYEILPEGESEGGARTNPEDGSYKIVLPVGNKYGFNANAKGYFPISDNIDLTEINEYSEINKDLKLMPIEVGQTIRLNNIFFDFNKTSLRDESFPELERVVSILKENPQMEIQISGHTDDIGSDYFNNNLSKARAEAVETYLVKKGINKNRTSAVGYGKAKPLAPNSLEEGRQLNRRVEFTILRN